MSKCIPSIEQMSAVCKASMNLLASTRQKEDREDPRAYERRCAIPLPDLIEAIRPVRSLLEHVEGWQESPGFESALHDFLEAFDAAVPEWPNNDDQLGRLGAAIGRLSRCVRQPDRTPFQLAGDPPNLDWLHPMSQTQRPKNGDSEIQLKPVKPLRARGRNHDRDEFVVAQYEEGIDVKIIIKDANTNKDWAPIGDESHLRNIYKRWYAKREETPQTRKPSRT